MKTLLATVLFLCLSTSLYAEQNYKFDIYNVNAYNRSIPALSLAITPQKSDGFRFILSYISTIFSLNKEQHINEYALGDKYTNVQVSFNFRF